MLICVKFDCKCLIVRELRNLRRFHLSRYFTFVKVYKFNLRRKEFIFIYKWYLSGYLIERNYL